MTIRYRSVVIGYKLFPGARFQKQIIRFARYTMFQY